MNEIEIQIYNNPLSIEKSDVALDIKWLKIEARLDEDRYGYVTTEFANSQASILTLVVGNLVYSSIGQKASMTYYFPDFNINP